MAHLPRNEETAGAGKESRGLERIETEVISRSAPAG